MHQNNVEEFHWDNKGSLLEMYDMYAYQQSSMSPAQQERLLCKVWEDENWSTNTKINCYHSDYSASIKSLFHCSVSISNAEGQPWNFRYAKTKSWKIGSKSSAIWMCVSLSNTLPKTGKTVTGLQFFLSRTLFSCGVVWFVRASRYQVLVIC